MTSRWVVFLVTGMLSLLLTACAGTPTDAAADRVEHTDAPATGNDDDAAQDGDDEIVPEPDRVAVPTQEPPDPDTIYDDGDGSGYLSGDPDIDGGCLWVEDTQLRAVDGEEKRVEVLTPVVWPHGYAAAFDPPRLLDPDGRVVATEGDFLHMAGGYTLSPEEMGMDHCGHIDPDDSGSLVGYVCYTPAVSNVPEGTP